MAGSKAGRRKKSGPRYPSGKLVPGEELPAGLLWQRIRERAVTDAGDARMGSQIGLLSLKGALTNVQVAAAIEVRDICAQWHRFEEQRPHTASPSWEFGLRGASLAGTAEDYARKRAKAKKRWERLQDCYPNSAARAVIEDLCVHDLHISPVVLPDVARLLSLIAVRFNLDKSGGAMRYQQAPGAPRAPVLRVIGPEPGKERVVPLAPTPERVSASKAAWMATVRKLNPQASDVDLAKLFDEFTARQDRERFRRAKASRAPS